MRAELAFDAKEVRVQSTADIPRAAAAVARYAREFGNFRAAVCANIASTRPMTDAGGNVLASDVFGWNPKTQCWWGDQVIALRSPLTQLCRYESEPVWVNAGGARKHGPSAFLDALDFSMLNGIDVVKAAIVVPVHLPFSQIGLATFSCVDDARVDLNDEFERYSPLLQLMTHIFIGSFVQLRAANGHIPRNCELTKREAECLRWAAIGKTDEEIAEIISRTHGTVRYHLHNSGAKLNAVTRTQAVFKATQLGYLGTPL